MRPALLTGAHRFIMSYSLVHLITYFQCFLLKLKLSKDDLQCRLFYRASGLSAWCRAPPPFKTWPSTPWWIITLYKDDFKCRPFFRASGWRSVWCRAPPPFTTWPSTPWWSPRCPSLIARPSAGLSTDSPRIWMTVSYYKLLFVWPFNQRCRSKFLNCWMLKYFWEKKHLNIRIFVRNTSDVA